MQRQNYDGFFFSFEKVHYQMLNFCIKKNEENDFDSKPKCKKSRSIHLLQRKKMIQISNANEDDRENKTNRKSEPNSKHVFNGNRISWLKFHFVFLRFFQSWKNFAFKKVCDEVREILVSIFIIISTYENFV